MPDLKRTIESGESSLKFRLGPSEWDFIRILPGEFRMGSAAADPDPDDGVKPAQTVRITRPFYLSKYQISQAQYAAVMRDNHRSRFSGDDLPVQNVLYWEALNFCRQMSSLTTVSVSLPTEAQWEYACRAGTTTAFYNGNSVADLDRIAWFRDNSEGRVHPVGRKLPNAWGLHDMLGNVYEPCLDYISVSMSKLPSDDPVGSRLADRGIIRGGYWGSDARACSAAARILTNDMFGGNGLRVAINPH